MATLINQIEDELRSEGVAPFSNDNVDRDYLILPKQLDILPVSEVGRYLHTVIQQRMYVRTLLSRTRAIMREAQRELDLEKLRVYRSLPPRMSVTEKELSLRTDAIANEKLLFLTKVQEKYEYLKDVMESLEDAKFSVSRELSRRGMDFKDEMRSSKCEK